MIMWPTDRRLLLQQEIARILVQQQNRSSLSGGQHHNRNSSERDGQIIGQGIAPTLSLGLRPPEQAPAGCEAVLLNQLIQHSTQGSTSIQLQLELLRLRQREEALTQRNEELRRLQSLRSLAQQNDNAHTYSALLNREQQHSLPSATNSTLCSSITDANIRAISLPSDTSMKPKMHQDEMSIRAVVANAGDSLRSTGVPKESVPVAPKPFEQVAPEKASDRKPKKKSLKWMTMLEQLKDYRGHHGDCIVPRGYPPNPKLASWVAEQRKQYKLFKDGRQSSMTEERIDLLNEVEFAWNAQEAAWTRHFEDLKKFRSESGHCHVPLNHPRFPKLGLWVKEARRHHTLLKQGKQSHMTADRIEKLNSIGFCWDTHEATWLDRLSELAAYKEKHGNCIVPTNFSENPRLGTWVHHQRRQYKRLSEGKPCHITKERIRQLNELGFVWHLRAEKSDSDASSDGDETDSDQSSFDEQPRKRVRRV